MKKILFSLLIIAFTSFGWTCGDQDVQAPVLVPLTLEQWQEQHPGMTTEIYNQLLEAGHVPPYPPPPPQQ